MSGGRRRAARYRLAPAVALLVALAGTAAGCTGSSPPPGRDPSGGDGPTLPDPDLGRLDPAVRAILERRREELAGRLRDTSLSGPALAAAYGDLGRSYLAAKLDGAAEICFSEARRLAPEDPGWHHALGVALHRLGRVDEAAAAFEEALSLRPDDEAAMVRLANLHIESNRPDLAEPLFARVLEIAPDSAAARFGLGRISLDRKDPAGAAGHFEAALASAPSATSVHSPLAMAYRDLGRLDDAERHLKMIGPGDVPVNDPLTDGLAALLPNPLADMNRGLEAFAAERWEEAGEWFARAVEGYPENPAARWNLGAALQRQGRRDEAMEQYRRTLELSPDHAAALHSIGTLMAESGSMEEAIAYYRRAVEADPGLEEARVNLADALWKERRFAEALPHFEEAARLDPANRAARMGHAMALIRAGRFARAKGALEDSMSAFPEDPVFPHFLARLLSTSPEETVRDGERALGLVRDVARRQNSLALAQTTAMALAEVGRFDEAASLQRSAIEAAREGGRSDLLPPMQRNLALYEQRRPCRDFWLEGAPPAG